MKLTFPWLSDDYVSDWARTVQPGAGKDRGWLVLPEVGDEVLVAFEQGDFGRPYVLGGLYNGVDTMPAGPVDLVDGGSGRGQPALDGVPAAGTGSTCSTRTARPRASRWPPSDDKLKLIKLDQAGTTITVHADGKVMIEGNQGITIDSAARRLELKGGQISLKATSGVTVDGGGGAVEVKAGSQLSLTGASAKLEGSGNDRGQGRRDVHHLRPPWSRSITKID